MPEQPLETQTNPSEQFHVALGVVAGYAHEGHISDSAALALVVDEWRLAAQYEAATSGMWVTSVAHPARAVYALEWGCPAEGEVVVEVVGNRNPLRALDAQAWHDAVVRVVTAVCSALDQASAQLTFSNVEHIYLFDPPRVPGLLD